MLTSNGAAETSINCCGNAKWYSYFERQFDNFFTKLSILLLLVYDPAIALPGIYLTEAKLNVYTKT